MVVGAYGRCEYDSHGSGHQKKKNQGKQAWTSRISSFSYWSSGGGVLQRVISLVSLASCRFVNGDIAAGPVVANSNPSQAKLVECDHDTLNLDASWWMNERMNE